MKKVLYTILALLIFSAGFGSNWVPLGSDSPVAANVKLVYSDIRKSTIHFSLQGFEMIPISTPRGTSFVIGVAEATPLLVGGAPDLGKLTASIIIPDQEKMEVKVIHSDYKDFENIEVAPSKGNLYRDTDPATVPFTWGKVYSENKFFPENIVELREPYIIRDYRGETVVVYPFQYNPVSKILRVYTNIEINVYSSGEKGVNTLSRKGNLTKVNSEFNKIYQQRFLNADNSRYTPVDEQGKMLIISYGPFMNAMQPLVDWKNQQGIPTEIVNVASIGTTAAAIKAYILNYYNNNDLAFVLLVGDGPQIPTNSGGGLGGPSDNAYGYLVGNDHYPDLFVGRFSAENVTHVQTQVAKVLSYEKNPLTTVDWFSKSLGIASDQGPGDNNEYDYQHIRNIRTKLLNYTCTSVAELYDGTKGGLDAPGNPTPTMVAAGLNAGAGIVNYTGHGSKISWGSSGFSNSNINALTNDNMLPFIWAVACVNGDFVSGTCFAEAWLRATHSGQPSGAVATLMSTINQSWDPPMCGQDAMEDILVETFAGNIKRTFGGISMNGCMQMNDKYGADGDEMTDTWNCFGDPSLMLRTAMPHSITASHPSVILPGADQFTVNSDAEGGVVALTIKNQIIAAGNITDSTVTLNFEAVSSTDTIKMVITAYNHLPYEADLPVVQAAVTGIVTYANEPNTPLTGLTLNLKNANGDIIGATTTNATGNYTFPDVPSGNYSLEVETTKQWSGVMASDVLLYRKCIANIFLLEGIYLNSGDVNASGSLSAADVLLINKRIAAITNSFPVGDWLFDNTPFTYGGGSVTRNFKGIIYGDANGSYIPPGSNKSPGPIQQGSVSIESIAADKDQIIVPVRVSDIRNLGAFQFTIQYDPGKLTINDITDWYAGIDAVTVGTPAPGLITFVWAADEKGISISDGILCKLHFSSCSADNSAITFTGNPTQIEFSDFDGNIIEPVLVNSKIGSPSGIGEIDNTFFGIYPNPFIDHATIKYTIKTDCDVTLSIYNAIGQQVKILSCIQGQKAGSYAISFDGAGLEPGVYYCKLKLNNAMIVKKLVLSR